MLGGSLVGQHASAGLGIGSAQTMGAAPSPAPQRHPVVPYLLG